MARTKRILKPAVDISSFLDVLNACGPRPEPFAQREGKKNWSELLSNKAAVLIANKLRATGGFKGEILPSPSGKGREAPVPSGAFNKPKKTDVNYSTLSGLELLVSIKTLGFKDIDRKTHRVGRYTKNMLRNDHELRAEAMEFHERYPYAVLVALFFIPRDSCDDGETDKSSFAHAVMTFRARTGRARPDEPAQMFELFFIGLYDWDGPHRGRLEFFDVSDVPRRRGVPSRLMSIDEVVRRIVSVYGLRNRLYIPFEDDESEGGVRAPQLDLSTEGLETGSESPAEPEEEE